MATGASATAGGPGAQEAAYGLCYGTKTSYPRRPVEVVNIYKRRNISKMWLSPTPLSSPKNDVIDILDRIIGNPSPTLKMQIVLCINSKDLELLADQGNAKKWVDTYITSYVSVISYVCVGDVVPSTEFPPSKFKDAVRNLAKILQENIKLSAIVNQSFLLGPSYKADTYPSSCELTEESQTALQFLTDLLGSSMTLFVRMMPYLMITKDVPIKNCLLNYDADDYMQDGECKYIEAYDAMIDSICGALKKVVVLSKVDILVVSGWPTAGPKDYASEKYAKQYIPNLVQRIGRPNTPRGNKPVDTFIYSLVDEDMLPAPMEEFKHLGAEAYLP